MARRSDHTPSELRALFVASGHSLISERGLASFSAREAARRAGYSVGSIYHVFGSLDAYVVAINTATLARFAHWLGAAVSACPPAGDRLHCLVAAYFEFAETHTHAWAAAFDHRRPRAVEPDAADVAERVKLTAIVDEEVAAALGCPVNAVSKRLARSLIATVHGHCVMAVTGNFALMNEDDPVGQAVARVRESIAWRKAALGADPAGAPGVDG